MLSVISLARASAILARIQLRRRVFRFSIVAHGFFYFSELVLKSIELQLKLLISDLKVLKRRVEPQSSCHCVVLKLSHKLSHLILQRNKVGLLAAHLHLRLGLVSASQRHLFLFQIVQSLVYDKHGLLRVVSN